MEDKAVLYEVKDRIAYITLNRPERLNTINPETTKALDDAFNRFEADTDAWVALLSGKGKAFCAGLDLKYQAFYREEEEQKGGKGTVPTDLTVQSRNGLTILKPVVGAIHGYAIGGGFVRAVCLCDITVCAEGTKFSYPEARFNIGNVTDTIAYVPLKFMLELMLVGEQIDAQRAYEMGFVNKVVPQEQLMAEAVKYCENIKKGAPLCLKLLKYGLYKSMDTAERWVRRDLVCENERFVEPMNKSKDAKEH